MPNTKTPSNPGNSYDRDKKNHPAQKSSEEITGAKKRSEKEQDKHNGRGGEVVERESPEVHTDKDPRF